MVYETTIPRSLLAAHKSDAVIITCVDPRFFEKTILEFARAAKSQGGLGLTLSDPLIIPGACKGLAESNPTTMAFVKDFLDLVIPAHSIKQIIAVHHPTCAAYGIKDAEEESKVQRADIKTAADILHEWYPEILISTFMIEAGEAQGEIVPLTYRPVYTGPSKK